MCKCLITRFNRYSQSCSKDGKDSDILRETKPKETKMVNILLLQPHEHLTKDLLLQIINEIDFYSKSYENITVIGNFNAEISVNHMDSFCAVQGVNLLQKS